MTETIFRERLQAIIDWADLAMKNRAEFDSHGVRNLDGPAFDAAREALTAAPAPAPSSRGTADIDQKALAVADDLVRQMIEKGALLAIRDNEGELVPMALERQFQLKAGWQIAIGNALATSEGSTDA